MNTYLDRFLGFGECSIDEDGFTYTFTHYCNDNEIAFLVDGSYLTLTLSFEGKLKAEYEQFSEDVKVLTKKATTFDAESLTLPQLIKWVKSCIV